MSLYSAAVRTLFYTVGRHCDICASIDYTCGPYQLDCIANINCHLKFKDESSTRIELYILLSFVV